MALNPVATVNISLQTTAVSRAGFGTPMFIASHSAYLSRVRSYASVQDVAADFSTTSDPYLAALAFFSNTPSGPLFKVGRRDSDAILTPENVAENTVYEVTVTVNDNDSVTANYTALLADTAEEIATALKADIDAVTEVTDHITATVVGVGAAATLEISGNTSSDVFSITGLENLADTYTSTETGADALNAILEEDEDFYFVAAEEDSVFRGELSTAVEAMDRLFFQASSDTAILDAPASSTPTKDRTITLWHEDSENFPEVQWIGVNAPYAPDENAVTWAGNQLSLFAESKDPRTGNKLTSTQQTNVLSYGYNMVALVGGVPVTRPGKVESGEWIDTIRGRDTMTARIGERISSLIINQQGGKIPYTASGISQIDSALSAALQPFVDSNFLESYVTNPPLITEIPAADKQARVLRNVQFTAFLAGAIHEAVFNGVLTISEG